MRVILIAIEDNDEAWDFFSEAVDARFQRVIMVNDDDPKSVKEILELMGPANG